MTEIINKIKSQKNKVKMEVKAKVAGYIVAAFGLVAGLAWNEAIKALIEHIFPISKDTLLAKFIYAIAITIFVVIIAGYIVKIINPEKEK